MLPGNIIQLKAAQTYLSQSILNVFYYEVVALDEGVTLEHVLTTFTGFWTTNIKPLQVTGCVLATLEAKDLSNGIDIASRSVNVAGSLTGDGVPSFVTLSFRLNRTTGLTRHGQKRFAGCSEAAIIGNDLSGGVLTAANAAAVAMAGGLLSDSGTNDHELKPVIIGRTLQQDGSYELDITKVNDVQSAQYVRVSTQTTRRAGRGI